MRNVFREVAPSKEFPLYRRWENESGVEIYKIGYGRGEAYARVESRELKGVYRALWNAEENVGSMTLTPKGVRFGGCGKFLLAFMA